MTEQSPPDQLVRDLQMAEAAGFDFSVCSDHYQPWLAEQGHSGYAWSILGAAAQATERIGLMTYVTCPTIRYHPAVVAQKAATLQILSGNRFRLGLGAGENLNEHVVGERWPAVGAAPRDAQRGGRHHLRAVRRRRGARQLPRSSLRRRAGATVGSARAAGPDRHRRLRRELVPAGRSQGRPDDRGRAQARAGGDVRRRRRRGQAAGRAGGARLRHRPRRRGGPRPRAVPLVRAGLEGERRSAQPRVVRRRHRVGDGRAGVRAARLRPGRRRARREDQADSSKPASTRSPWSRSAPTSRSRSSAGPSASCSRRCAASSPIEPARGRRSRRPRPRRRVARARS